MAAAAAAARLSSSSHLMDEGVGSRSSRSGRRLPPEFGRDLAVLMILKFMLLCGYKNMAVNNSYAFQRLQMPQGLPNKGSLKRNGLTKKGQPRSDMLCVCFCPGESMGKSIMGCQVRGWVRAGGWVDSSRLLAPCSLPPSRDSSSSKSLGPIRRSLGYMRLVRSFIYPPVSLPLPSSPPIPFVLDPCLPIQFPFAVLLAPIHGERDGRERISVGARVEPESRRKQGLGVRGRRGLAGVAGVAAAGRAATARRPDRQRPRGEGTGRRIQAGEAWGPRGLGWRSPEFLRLIWRGPWQCT
nr:uncharacterized protein LOC109751902 isoform X1 [Aegilops tauschii subsp. strangulata]